MVWLLLLQIQNFSWVLLEYSVDFWDPFALISAIHPNARYSSSFNNSACFGLPRRFLPN